VWDASQRRDHDTALSYFGQAARAARSRADPAAESLALLRTGMVALYGHKDQRAGFVLCEQAAATAGTASRVLGGLAVLHTAEAHAMLGDRASCEQALGDADQQLTGVRHEDPAIDLYSPAQRGRMAGSCYLFLDDARRAAPILEDTARRYQDHSKSEAIVLGNLALARIRQGELDGAVASVHQAIDVIELTRGGGGLNIVFTATLELRRWQQSTPVRDLQDRVLTLMTAG
jgi:hypothetical protein